MKIRWDQKKGSMVTQAIASNGLQDVAPISTLCILDLGVDNEHNMAKDSTDNVDNEHKTSTNLRKSVSSKGHKIVKLSENGDIMNHEHRKTHSPIEEIPDCKNINQGASNVH